LFNMPPLDDSIISRKKLQKLFSRGGVQPGGGGHRAAGLRSGTDSRHDDGGTAAAATPPKSGQAYWRSLNELAQTPEFEDMLQREFSAVAADVIEPSSRRDFLKIMGASLALAGVGLTGCRWPDEKIAPFARKQEGYTMGVPVQFATAMDISGVATGLLVTSYDGRPIKIEGNPLHPGSLGAAGMYHQASVLDIYDANRSKYPIKRNEPGSDGEVSSFAAFTSEVQPLLASHRQSLGARLAILCEAHSSPTRARLQAELAKHLPLLQWYEYEPVSWDQQRAGTRRAFGQPLRPQYQLDQADVIVSFGCDFLVQHPDSLHLARDWAKGRRGTGGRMNRTYVVESVHSLSGAKADHRIMLKPSAMEYALVSLAAALNQQLNLGLPAEVLGGPRAEFATENGKKAWDALTLDLAQAAGRSVILAGPQLSPQAHALVAALNYSLGSVGTTLSYSVEESPLRQSHSEALAQLTGQIGSGNIDTLLIIGGNPVLDAPADVDFAGALGRVRGVHLSLHDNETSRHCKWHMNRAHYLEEWGDARAYDGTYSVVQPLIDPLYGGLTPHELLSFVLDGVQRKAYDQVRETFAGLAGSADFEAQWRTVLHDGVLKGSAATTFRPPVLQVAELQGVALNKPGELELVVTPDYSLYDGRFANNGWLQETPDPMTKLTWDNAAVISVPDSQRLGLNHEDQIELTVEGQTVRLPVYVMPGQTPGVVHTTLGYGRTAAGDVGNGVGSNTYALRRERGWVSATLAKTGHTYFLAETQDHFAIDPRGFNERAERVPLLVREGKLELYKKEPNFSKLMEEDPEWESRWHDWKYEGHRWGMSIDLATCTGCSACIVACSAENNTPIVGKLRVRQGREMQWLRIDRYFRGDPTEAKVALQPLTCHHCELAPCEQVCPVNATTHSDEGLNDMVYNRCIGTRYCSNNCPFKVRRFNFFNYQKSLTETQKLVFNPNVTVRSRGVMEKCTYCVQRIQNGKIAAKVEGRELVDGEIQTACQQTCPTEAITFGDLNLQTSKVFDQRYGHLNDRAYTMLNELQVRPRTSYLAGLRNPAAGTAEYAEPDPELFEREHEDTVYVYRKDVTGNPASQEEAPAGH
jgi:molybdopterin-containing oxidoreductase family iron-sulfur binding subunit